MRLYIHVQLDSGGAINLSGSDLSAEDINEVFAVLAGKTVTSSVVTSLTNGSVLCAVCRQPIIGGKGDWWHGTPEGGYGDMRGPDGHLATPEHATMPAD